MRRLRRRVNKSLFFTEYRNRMKSSKNKKDCYILNINYFNLGIVNINCFKLAIFFKKCVDSYFLKIRESKMKCKEEHISKSGIDEEDYNPQYNELNRLYKYLFDMGEVDSEEVEFDPLHPFTFNLIEVYKSYDKEDSLKIKSIGRASNIASLCDKHPTTPYMQYEKSGRWFYIPTEWVAKASSPTELLVFSLMLNYKPEKGEWGVRILKAILDDMQQKGQVDGSFSKPNLTRYFNNFKKLYKEDKNLLKVDTTKEKKKPHAEDSKPSQTIPTDSRLKLVYSKPKEEEQKEEKIELTLVGSS